MKTAFTLFLLSVLFVSCQHGAEDSKNEHEPFPTYDTTDPVEKKNSPADSLGG